MMRVCPESTTTVADSKAMQTILCFFTLLWSLLSTFFQTIWQRFPIAVESRKLDSEFHDAQEYLLLNEDEAKSEMMSLSADEKCLSDSDNESVDFECPRVSDFGMETEHSVSALLLQDASTHLHSFADSDLVKLDLKTTQLDTENASKFDQQKELQGSPKRPDSDSDNEFRFRIIQQQLDVVHKIKMENNKPKSGGLPTILEDLESPKVAEDMKPLKLNNKKIELKDLIKQVQSFHKIYTAKMHKLDILNQQTLDALSFIGLKGHDQEDLMQRKKKKRLSSTVVAMRSAFSIKLLCTRVSCDEAAAHESSGGLMSRLELIYVGQLCLSWEILNWQHGRAIKLQQLDLQASRLYNQVAVEFQQFQVALQRFVENEASQGPRVQNYVERRAAFSRFLQVPLIKDDCLKDKKLNKGERIITISALVRIIDECRRVFYEFIREKKNGGTKAVLRDQSTQALFIQAHAKLHERKKRVRELKRSKGSIVKMICHTREQPWLDQALFVAGVELKLVARVLRMSEISREQIIWCHKKLDEMKLVDRRLYIEPTFLLFPC